MEPYLSKQQCCFKKGYSIQHYLLVMLEKRKAAAGMRTFFEAILTDLLKAFDCVPHDLLLEKLHALGFNINALRLIKNY